MKNIILFAAMLAISPFSFAVPLGLDTAKAMPQDTTIKASPNSITLGSNQQPYNPTTLGFSIASNGDNNALHNNAGLPVMNVLRGQSSNFYLSPSAFGFGANIRGRSPLLVVDGFGYGYGMTTSLSMRAFDYADIVVINDGGAAATYAGGGLAGLLVLKSKTGEGYDRPHIEFNTHSTYGYFRDTPFGPGDSPEKVKKWQFSNAIAYSQDFGIVDTRVSYAFTTSPAQNVGYNYKNRNHAIRINTGFNFSEKFNARLILDDNYDKLFYDDDNQSETSENPYGKSTEETLRANLSLVYTPATWIRFNGQAGVNRIKGDSESKTGSREYSLLYTDQYDHNQGKFINTFVTFLPKLSDRVTMNIFTGFQREKFRPLTNGSSHSYYGGQWASSSGYSRSVNADLTTTISGIGINVDNVFSFDVTYRNEDDDNKHYETFAGTTAFVFANAPDAGFSFGKLRLSLAKSDLLQSTRYPLTLPTTYYEIDVPSAGTNSEGGIDLSFARNRIGLSVSYFDFRQDENWTYIYHHPWEYYVPIALGKTSTRGWEITASAQTIKNENLSLSSKVTWGQWKRHFDNENYQFLAGGTYQWTMGWSSQLNYKAFYFSFLVDFLHGNNAEILVYPSPDFEKETLYGSITRLRDVTAGITLQPSGLRKIGVNGLNLSVIGRNLWTIYPGGDRINTEDYQNISFLKTMSLSATVTF